MGVRSRSSAGALYSQSTSGTAGGIGSANIPRAAMCAEGYVKTASVTYTTDGTTTPTSTVGEGPAYPDDIILLGSRAEIDKFSAVTLAGTGTIDWAFFTDLAG